MSALIKDIKLKQNPQEFWSKYFSHIFVDRGLCTKFTVTGLIECVNMVKIVKIMETWSLLSKTIQDSN